MDACSNYSLPQIPYLRLRASLKANRAAQLPAYKGSLLRGAFGHALRRMVCAMAPQEPCASCALRQDCIHARLFEEPIDANLPSFLEGLPAAPRPFVFEPGATTRDYRAGDLLELDLLLFGQVIELQAFAVKAIANMAAAGLGSRRVPFELERVRFEDAQGKWHSWQAAAPPLHPSRDPLDSQRLRLRFVTPTRIKVKGRLIDDLTFRTFVQRAVRRILELAHFYVPSLTIDPNYQPLLDQADGVRAVDSDLRWEDWQRYSNRQQAKMSMGGFVGQVTLVGDLSPFSELLRAAEVVHVGKGTTFGLGKVQLG